MNPISCIDPLETRTRPHPPATLRVAMRAGRCAKRCRQVASYSIESLESRVAPAAVVTYTDIDGDIVKITASKGPLDAADLTFLGGGTSGQLATLNLTDPGFDGARIIFSVTKKPGGDGLAHVGLINAAGVDLDRVVVKGDLGAIGAGDATAANDPGLNLLQVRSMGTLGLATQGGTGSSVSEIHGRLGALKVAGDFTGVSLVVSGGVDGQIGSVFIAGDLIGGSGNLFENGGVIACDGALGSVHINGDLVGGSGSETGAIFTSGRIGNVFLRGNLIGGAGEGSGRIESFTGIGNVLIGHNVIGGTGSSSGAIFCGGDIGNIRVNGDLIGGRAAGFGSLEKSGAIISDGRINSVTLAGSLVAGSESGLLVLASRCGAIIAGDDIGPVKIAGSIVGSATNPALIIAKGQHVKPTSGFDTAIASLSVKGDVRFAQILAGFDSDRVPANADAAIGTVTIGHDWAASSLVAGAQDTGALGFGVGDTLQTAGDTALIARIASITIKGSATGSFYPGDCFGFVAEQIDKLVFAGRTIPLTAGPGNDHVLAPSIDDVHLLEVS
jgi:hypothetical protein